VISVLSVFIIYDVIVNPTKKSEGNTSFMDRLDREIEVVKYDISKYPYNDTYERYDDPRLQPLLLAAEGDVRSAIPGRKPVFYTAASVASWNILKLNLWSFSKKWPVLGGLLKLRVRDKDGKYPVFVIENEPPEGGVIGVSQEPGRPQLVSNMLLTTLLQEFRNPSTKYFYSTNYLVTERVTNVTSFFLTIKQPITSNSHSDDTRHELVQFNIRRRVFQ
jgi:hypothetical protein